MKREFYLMIEGFNEQYIETFITRFKSKIEKEKGMLTKLKDYENFSGNYIVSLTNKDLDPPSKKIIRTRKFNERMEKCVGGVYLPDTFEKFLSLHRDKQTLIEIGEGKDAITGTIFIKKRGYYLRGRILEDLKIISINDYSLDTIL